MTMDPSEYETGKIFVGGLSWETMEESMKAYFEQFGVVTDCVVMRDPMQSRGVKKNRGFGFVKFEDPTAVDRVMQANEHMLDGKAVEPKRAEKKSKGKDTDKKVFLGGLASTTSEKDVEDYFNTHYGGVMEVVFKVDKTTNRKRGFGFVVFETSEYVEKVLQVQYHEIDGKKVEAKRTEPRSATASAMRHTNPALFAPYPQPPYPDYRGASNGHAYPPAPGQWGPGGQPYYDPYAQQQQGGYGAQYNSAAGYTYNHSYPRTQTSTDRQDPQSYYHHQNPYGHGGGGQQMGYGHDGGAYPAGPGRGGGYPAGGYGGYSGQQPPGGYGRGAPQQVRGGYGQ